MGVYMENKDIKSRNSKFYQKLLEIWPTVTQSLPVLSSYISRGKGLLLAKLALLLHSAPVGYHQHHHKKIHTLQKGEFFFQEMMGGCFSTDASCPAHYSCIARSDQHLHRVTTGRQKLSGNNV